MEYDATPRGDRIPDFSHAGFGGGAAIPDAPAKLLVRSVAGDNTGHIQSALDHVAGLPSDKAGLRGAVLLAAGRYEVAGQIRIPSGVVLRGQGRETLLVATGSNRRALVVIRGKADRTWEPKSFAVTDKYAPVGANVLKLESTDGLSVADVVAVDHPSTKAWIAALGMDRFPSRDKGSYLDWKSGTLDQRWERQIVAIKGSVITLDAPLTSALDSELSKSVVRKFAWPERVRNAGVENLRCESAFNKSRPLDEDHAWDGVLIESAEDVWVRQVSFRHFAGSAVRVWETARRVTVSDCDSAEPVSELGGFRRDTFFTAGQQTLFLRCTATGGRHDFATGHLAAGPNAFVQCKATDARRNSGPLGSWATGVLYDGVTIDGGGLALTNRETDDQGTGWAAANSVLWQCTAPEVVCRMPPTGQNWAIGVWGHFTGDGHWRQLNEFVKPGSLYAAQLADRIGGERAKAVLAKVTIHTDASGVKDAPEPAASALTVPPAFAPLRLTNGWLTTGETLLTGTRTGTAWWRGHTLPARAAEVGVGVTRFVPGRDGAGDTDNLGELAAEMKAKNIARLEHHWGLWYDRRRDDHQMVRRIDGEVWAPFYEQPWARNGTGKAWDGLSKYDLTKFNQWYFARLKAFAEACGANGRVLVQQMYFQHNVLEAGAHWADFAWRPANCVQETGFPEPPVYVGDKRVFMAEPFYDVTHPVRRDLHRRYIRHCLDTLGGCPNVVFQLGEEFTGPKAFVEFWLDTVAEWKKETGKTVLVSLSCTKDVQDAILADPVRAKLVSVIDLKYWWYTAGGKVYDPKGAENLAPRQQLREWKGDKTRSPDSVARMVREYRAKFPDKAVTVSLDGDHGWAALAGGASLPALPAGTDATLLAVLPTLKLFEAKTLTAWQFALADAGKQYLVYSADGAVQLELPAGEYAANWIDTKTGKAAAPVTIRGGDVATFKPPGSGPAVLWLTRNGQ